MAEPDVKSQEAFRCVRCGAPCEVTRAGDLWVATCPAGDLRYVLTVQAPCEVALGMEDPLAGETLGPCRLVARLGMEGGLPLYQGLDTELGLTRSVRVLSGGGAADQAQRDAFIRSGKLGAAVCHATLASIILLTQVKKALIAVGPGLEGEPLDRAVRRAGSLPPPDALRIARRLAEGLAALHSRGIVHRNVGPHSVFLLPNGEPLLRNFAFATSPTAPGKLREVAGQPGFLAPEQATGGKLDGRADLYSLGALLYFTLVGRPPFAGPTVAETLRDQLAGPTAACQALAPRASKELVGLVTRLLSPDPEARPKHAQEVLDALTETTPAPAQGPELAPKARVLREAPVEEDALALAAEEPAVGEREHPRPLPALELPPTPRRGQGHPRPAKTRPTEKAAGPALRVQKPGAASAPPPRGAPRLGGETRRRPLPARGTPSPAAGSPPAPPIEELVLQAEEPGEGGAAAGSMWPDQEPGPRRGPLAPWVLALAAVAAVALGVFLVTQFVSCEPKPEQKADGGRPRGPARPGQKVLTEAEKAEAEAKHEAARIEALARKGPKEAEEVVKQCEAFLQRFGTGEQAEAVKKLRDAALTAQRERDAEAEFRTLQTAFRDRKRAFAERLEDLDAFLKAHTGTKAAAEAAKLREQTLAERELAAERAVVPAKRDLDKHLKAEAYGLAIELLTGLAEAHEGTKAGAAAAAQAAELRQKLAAEMKEKRAAADQRLRRAAFGEAIAQFDAPLKTWQFEELRREAADFVASVRQRRDKIVLSYGTFLGELNTLAGDWKLEEARAAATEAAAKADDPVLRELLQGKADEMAALLRARDRIVAGAKAEQAKAAQSGDKIWLQRTSGARLKATIDNPSATGLDADMLGYKGPVTWAEMHVDQLLLFAHSAPGNAAAADQTALGLLALRAGDMEAAFQEFTKAAEIDPGTLDTAAGFLRRHAQGFILVPGGQFPAGPKKEPATLDAFLLARAEVTNAEFAFFARATKAALPPDWKVGLDNHPVANITWQEADAYARWLDMRLPTDLEWERAVRGTEGRLYPWGDKFEASRANLARSGAKGPLVPSPLIPAYRHPRRDDSPFFHLVGNVRELTATPLLDPKGAVASYRVVGGSAADPETAALSHARATRKADARDPYTGFRLAWPR